MSSTITPLAPKARAVYGAYATLRRRDLADQLTERLDAMHEFASSRSHTHAWDQAARHLAHATSAIAFVSAAPRKDRKDRHRIAVTVTMSAILAFERAHDVSLPYDDHGRYNPAPGTEYPFSVSDIGRAAVQLLGPDWDAESLPWGVGAYLDFKDQPGAGFTLGVDEDGDLYLADDLYDGSRTFFTDAVIIDGLPALAARIADTVRTLRADTD